MAERIPGYFTVDQARDFKTPLTISFAGMDAVGRNKEEKPVLGFDGLALKLVLSKGRNQQLSALFGADSSLIGKQICLAVEEIDGREQIVVMGVPYAEA